MSPTKTPTAQPIDDVKPPANGVDAQRAFSHDVKIEPAPQSAPSTPNQSSPPEPAETQPTPEQPPEEPPVEPAKPKPAHAKKPVLLIICALLVAGGLSAAAVMQYQRTNKTETPANTPTELQTGAEADDANAAQDLPTQQNDTQTQTPTEPEVKPDTPVQSGQIEPILPSDQPEQSAGGGEPDNPGPN